MRKRRWRRTSSFIPLPLFAPDEDELLVLLLVLDELEPLVEDLTVRRLPGVSHWVQQEAPEQVNAVLASWLRRFDPRPAYSA